MSTLRAMVQKPLPRWPCQRPTDNPYLQAWLHFNSAPKGAIQYKQNKVLAFSLITESQAGGTREYSTLLVSPTEKPWSLSPYLYTMTGCSTRDQNLWWPGEATESSTSGQTHALQCSVSSRVALAHIPGSDSTSSRSHMDAPTPCLASCD